MGLFFWKKNKYDIVPNPQELNSLVTNYGGHNNTIKINGKLIVPANYEVVLGKKGRVCDKFDTGEHFFSYSNLPYFCRKFNIDRLDDGKRTDKFVCDCYFVNKNLFAGKFKTYRKVELGTRAYGLFNAHVYGMYSYKVVNAREFMQSLLNEFDYIKTGEAESFIEDWVNDKVVSVLEKSGFILKDVVENNPIIAEKIKISLSKLFISAGLEIVDLQIYKYKLPSKYQQESDDNIARQQAIKNGEINVTAISKQNVSAVENTEVCKNKYENVKEQKSEQVFSKTQNNVAENINEQFVLNNQQSIFDMKTENHTSNNQNVEANVNEDKQDSQKQYVPFGNFVIEDKQGLSIDELSATNKTKQRTFVDLSLNKLYDDDNSQFVRCTRCGGENGLQSKKCQLCGEDLINEGE